MATTTIVTNSKITNDFGVGKVESGWKKYRLDQVAAPRDLGYFCPISFVYDYLPQVPVWLRPQSVSLSDVLGKDYAQIRGETKINGIAIHPAATALPVHTGLHTFRQTKHWQANENATRELLELFANDEQCASVMLGNGQSMATLARRQLQSNVLDSYSRFSIYMFTDADEKRIQLLAQSVVLIFIFDDMWENATSDMERKIRDEFIGRIQGNVPSSVADTPLQRRMHDIRKGFLDGDEEEGNGGVEVLQKLIEFCRHKHPRDFTSIREYLDYRFDDIANEFTWACTKFSLRSSEDLDNPKLARLFGFIGDQISIANDIASHQKEVQQFQDGKATEMINLVHTIMQVYRVDEAAPAKSIAYSWQLWTENEILKELERLKAEGNLSIEEWRLIDGCLVAASGNLLTSIVIARYGGERKRITL